MFVRRSRKVTVFILQVVYAISTYRVNERLVFKSKRENKTYKHTVEKTRRKVIRIIYGPCGC